MSDWQRVMVDVSTARRSALAAIRRHGLPAAVRQAALYWLPVAGDRALLGPFEGTAAELPPAPTRARTSRTPTQGHFRLHPAAERYTPVWVFGTAEDFLVVDAVDGAVGGRLGVPRQTGARWLLSATVLLVLSTLIGIEIIGALTTLGVLFPLQWVLYDLAPAQEGAVMALVLLAVFYWFGRRVMMIAESHLRSISAGHAQGWIDPGARPAESTAIWVLSWLLLYVGVVALATAHQSGTGLPVMLRYLTAAVCLFGFWIGHRYGARPKRRKPADYKEDPPLAEWAVVTIRVAVAGVLATIWGRFVEQMGALHASGLGFLDRGVGFQSLCVSIGIALAVLLALPRRTTAEGRRVLRAAVAMFVAMILGAQLGSLVGAVGALIATSGAAVLALRYSDISRELRLKVQLLLVLGLLVATAFGRVVGRVIGGFVAGSAGVAPGAKIFEWIVASAALAVLIDALAPPPGPAPSAPPGATPDRPSQRTDR